MDNRRFITFLVFFFAFSFLYWNVIVPQFFPVPQPAAVEEGADAAAQDDENEADDGTVAAAGDSSEAQGADGTDSDDPAVAENEAEKQDDQRLMPVVHPNRRPQLGSLDPDSGFFLQVELNSIGASVESVQLTDPKFRELDDQDQQVTVVGNNSSDNRSFSLAVDLIDAQLEPFDKTLETIDWEVIDAGSDLVTFGFDAPDRSVRVEKTYRLQAIDVPAGERKEAYRTNSKGFTITVDFKVSNLSEGPLDVVYEVQGPVGLVLENAEHTRKYRDVKLEFIGDDAAVTQGAKVIDGIYEDRFEEARANGDTPNPKELQALVRQKDSWTGAFRYAAVDVQFFAAVVSPLDSRPLEVRLKDRRIDRIYPTMVQKDRSDVRMSDISFRLVSSPVSIPANDSVIHSYAFFVGPKRSQLLDPEPLTATQVLDYGSWFGTIARGMHWLLDTFHTWGMPYVLAIISLTVLVRGCLFPLSRKQAISAAKMKDLQPKINELKVKYGEDKQKLAQAQMELWRKHKINPLGGCFPLLFQFPIFISLYTALNTAVDLRLSKFLWIDNLAAPDAIATMPRLPFLGSDFNLLPCITVVLFLIQQKLFMPPPADEQQAAQQKMMNFMTIFFGAMFWHVPSGLCIYFIASSLWGIAERKLLGTGSSAAVEEPTVTVKEEPKNTGNNKSDDEPPQQTFFGRLMAAAEEAQRQAEQNRDRSGGKGKGKKNRRKNR